MVDTVERPQVFLSYAAANQQYATRLFDSLGRLLGPDSVWIDTMVGSADRWEPATVEALRAADVLVVLLSRDDRDYSLSDSQRTELAAAHDLGRDVLLILVEPPPGPAPMAQDVTSYPTQILRDAFWDDDARTIASEINARATSAPPIRPDMPAPDMFFVGRQEILAQVVAALTGTSGERTPIVVITGPPGIGKTSVARVAAERVATAFPDGSIFVSLRNFTSTETVLETLLRHMGVDPKEMPDSLPGRQHLYRSLLSGKRLLVLLDDVESSADLRSLLPPRSRSAVLITTQSWSEGGFPAGEVTTFELSGLPIRDGLKVLRHSAGPDVVDADLASADRLVQAVDGSPLALRLVASQARTRGLTSLGPLATTLEGAERGEAAARLLLDRAYEALSPEQRRLFRRLAVLPTPHFEAGLAAALLDTDPAGVAEHLQPLAAASLIDTTTPGSYELSDLTYRFAAAQLDADETTQDRSAAFDRAIRWMSVRTAFSPEMPITRDYWTADDTLGYSPYADAIAAFVRHRGTRPPLTIGVTAPWGAGKTSLMRMVQERLDPRADRERWTPAQLRLTAEARKLLRARTDRLTNSELLHRTAEPPIEADARDLDVEPPQTADSWRPTVWFNPWMYQNGEQIWAGLAYEIITQVTGRLTTADRERFWLALNLRRIDRQVLRRRIYRQLVDRFLPWLLWLALAVVLATAGLFLAVVLPTIAGYLRIGAAGLMSLAGVTFSIGALVATLKFLGAKAAGSFGPLLRVPDPVKTAVDQSGTELKGAYTDLFPDPAYDRRLGFLHLVQTDMRRVLDLIATQERPLVVFVDDLDRCSPGAVVQVIEAINLFLAGEFPNCVFVVAMEPAVVAAHVESVYKDLAKHPEVSRSTAEGATLGWRFLEKIVQLPLNLPPPDPARQTRGYLDSLLERPTSAVTTPADPAPPSATTTTAPAPAATSDPAVTRTAAATPAPVTAPATPDRAALVRTLEAAIRRRNPTTGSLAEVALQAQREVLPGSPETVLPETSEAANRVLVELYSDSEARTAILAGVPGLASDNPREIKRFVNLFRFYSFIAQQHRLQGLSPAGGAEIAKLCVLAIRWPNLLALFGRPGDHAEPTNLGHLESSVRDGDANAWRNGLRRVGLLVQDQQVQTNPAWAEELRRFLSTEPRIADLADRML